MKSLLLVILVAITLTSTLSAQQQGQQDQRKGYGDEYGVISERNMFVKDRVRGRGDGEGSSTQPTTRPTEAPLTPEESYILRGVVYENDAFLAYFENLNTSRIEAVSIGSELAQVRIVDIALDAVELNKDGQTQWISIGRDLRGSPARAYSATAGTGAAPATGTAPSTADPGTLSLEERLRQRRLQERGGR